MKLYRQKFDTFIKQYDDLGYICSKKDYRDLVVDTAGAVFLNALLRKPQSLQEIYDKIAPQFIDANEQQLKTDIEEFLQMLEEQDFIVSGESEEELESKDNRFAYSNINPKTICEDFSPKKVLIDITSQEYLDEYFKNKAHLTSLQIELTSRCNERCVHCYIPHENKLFDIEDDLFYNVLEQCKEMGLLNLTLSGGEPMLHPHFLEYLQKAQEYDFAVNVLSNLTLLTDEIVQEMKKNRLSSVQVSLYSMNPETHDAITQQKGSFVKTRDAILKLIDNDIPLQIACPTMKQNKNDFADVMKWAEEHKVRAITDYIMMEKYDHTTENLDNRLSLDEVKNVINQINEHDDEYKERIAKADFDLLRKIKADGDELVCGVCINSICIVTNGNVYPCPGWQDYVCGNLKEKTLKEIWDNSEKVKFLRNIRKKDFKQCMNCEDKIFCAMCMVRNANENPEGDPFKINPHFCKVAKLSREIAMEWIEKMSKK